MTRLLGPREHLGEQRSLVGVRGAEERGGHLQRLAGGVVQRRVVIVLLFKLFDLAAQDAHAGSPRHAHMPRGRGERCHVLLQGRVKRFRRGEETFLQELDHKFGGVLLGGVAGLAHAPLAVFLEQRVGIKLLPRVCDADSGDLALGEARRAIPAFGQFRFEAAHHHGVQLFGIRFDSPGETLVIEQLQQGGKAFAIAVMRRGREKELVLEMRREAAYGQGALRVGGVLAAARRRDVMHLIDDQEVEAARVDRFSGTR